MQQSPTMFRWNTRCCISHVNHKLAVILLFHYFICSYNNNNYNNCIAQEGWLSPTERASVSAISPRHILAFPGTTAVNVTWMERRFNACQTYRSMYSSIFNHFPVIQPVSSKVHHFKHILTYPGYAPGTIAVNVTWMERRFNSCQTHSSISIYLQPFTTYSEILVANCNFSYRIALEFREKFGPQKTRIMGLPGSEDCLTIGWAVLTQY